jgi:diacylglycerol kinase
MRKFIKGFGYAFSGLAYTFKSQLNFKVHVSIAILVAISGYCFKLSSSEWLWIIASVGLVLMTELINTAIEQLVDLVSPEIHPKAKIIKDAAAGAVLVAAITAAGIGLVIFIPKLLQYAA